MKTIPFFLLSLVVFAAHGMNNNQNNKPHKIIKKHKMNAKASKAKRVKTTPDNSGPYDDYNFSSSVCQECGTEWLAQIDECPGCGKPTGFGEGYDVINHKYFVPKNK